MFHSGFINATEAVHNSVPVGAMMFVSGGLFLAGVIVDCFLLVKVITVLVSPLISFITFLSHLGRVILAIQPERLVYGEVVALKPDVSYT